MRERANEAQLHFLTRPAERRDLAVTVGATGTLEGLNTVEVGSEVSGKLTELLVDFNERVKEGQTLAVIDPEQSQAAVDEARANVTSSDAAVMEARASLDEARAASQRGKAQVEEGLISRQEYESLVATEKRAEASVTRSLASTTLARASLKSAKSKLTKTVIVSPIDGVVQSRLVEAGQTLTAGMSTPVLFKLTADLAKMKLSVAIDEADIGRVKEGQKATFTVDAYPGRMFESAVVSLRNDPTTDQNVVTYEGILAVDNEQRLLRPGMTATATIVTEMKRAVLAAPNAAFRFAMPKPKSPVGFGPPGGKPKINNSSQEDGVWILALGLPERRPAKAGATDGEYTELISTAVSEGDLLIVDVESAK